MISGFIEGYDLGVATINNLYIQDSLFIAIGPLGAAIGALISGIFADKWGRRPTVLLSNILYLLGGMFIVLYEFKYVLIYIGRFIVGLAIGVTSMNVPIYISEVVPNELRGRFVAWYTFSVVVGQFAANVASLILGRRIVWIYSIGEFFVIIQIIGILLVVPESPRWLAKNGQQAEAEKVLDQIYKPESVQIYKRSL